VGASIGVRECCRTGLGISRRGWAAFGEREANLGAPRRRLPSPSSNPKP